MKRILYFALFVFNAYPVPPDCSKIRYFWLTALSYKRQYTQKDLENAVRMHDYCLAKAALEARVDSNIEVILSVEGNKFQPHNLLTLVQLGVTMQNRSFVGAATTEDMKQLLLKHRAQPIFKCDGKGCDFTNVWKATVSSHKVSCPASIAIQGLSKK